ncbi:MAG: hypothetical protein J2O48_05350 [Solirubrobacterales bacterium]|nr:hypothetical protein [Solirubrobacterales bacterium]
MIAVVAVLIGGLIFAAGSGGVGKSVKDGLSNIVCELLHQRSCHKAAPAAKASGRPTGPQGPTKPVGPTSPAASKNPGTNDYPKSGPAIGGGYPVPVLPFNGASVSCTTTATIGKGEKTFGGKGSKSGEEPKPGESPAKGACDFPGQGSDDGKEPGKEGDGGAGGTKGSVSLSTSATFGVSRGDPTLNSDCSQSQTLDTNATISVKGSAGLEKGGAGVSGSASHNIKTDYQLTVSPSQVSALQNHKMATPNPLDPRSLPAGDGITLNRSTYNELDLGASYEHLSGQLGFQQGRQLSSGVKRLANGDIQISTGDAKLVANTMQLGIGNDDVGVDVGGGTTFIDGKMRQMEINIHSKQGWDAYQSFLHSGRLPKAGAAGVVNPVNVDVGTGSSTIKAEAKLFGLTIGGSSSPWNYSVTGTHNADGSETDSLTNREGDVTEVVTSNNRGKTPSKYQLLLQNVDPSEVNGYEQSTGEPVHNYSSNQNMVMNFTPAQLTQIRQRALDAMSTQSEEEHRPMSPQQIQQQLKKDPTFSPVPGVSPNELAIASAKNPGEVLQDMQTDGYVHSPNGLLQDLDEISARSAHMINPAPTLRQEVRPLSGLRICPKVG